MRKIIFIVAVVFISVNLFAEKLNSQKVLNKKKMKPQGKFYEATVPDTLDLAEKAKLCVNGLIGNIDPNNHYAVVQGFDFAGDKPGLGEVTWNIPEKNLRALPYMRTMCGSDANLNTEYETMKIFLDNIADDGRLYFIFDGAGPPKGSSYPIVNGLMAAAILNWSKRDNNPYWLDYYNLMCAGMKNSAIKVEDRAYYPPECGITPAGEWKWNLRGVPRVPYTPPDEPVIDQQGFEADVKYEQSPQIRALIAQYLMTKDPQSLDTASRLIRFVMKPGMWEDANSVNVRGNEHGIFAGHFHGNTAHLQAILDYAVATNNQKLMQFVREAYTNGQHLGVSKVGWFPGVTKLRVPPQGYHQEDSSPWYGVCEGCGTSDMLILAVKMSDAGLGDFWDDVDSIVRNQLIEQQVADSNLICKMNPKMESYKNILNQYAGGFGCATPTHIFPNSVYGCCTANGSIGLYYAWHGITRFDRGIATVNLFLNRTSEWLDIDSYLPYEGKVVIRNKKANTVNVRIPSWLDTSKLECFVNNKKMTPARSGSYIVFDKLKKGADISLRFDVPEFAEQYTIYKTKYNVKFRASTIVDIEPRPQQTDVYPIYQRDFMKSKTSPMHKVKRFVSDNILPLQ